MASLIAKGVVGDKGGRGFFTKEGGKRLVLDPATGDYKPGVEDSTFDMSYVHVVSRSFAQGRYREGLNAFLDAPGDAAAIARKVVAGYIAYSFERVGEVTETINDIDRIMGAGFNWAPPSVLVDTMGAARAAELITGAGLAVPAAIEAAAKAAKPQRFFVHPTMKPRQVLRRRLTAARSHRSTENDNT